MNKKDALWQSLLDEEKRRLSFLSTGELLAMESYTSRKIKNGGTTIECGIWHVIESEDVEYDTKEESLTFSAQLDKKFRIRRPQKGVHSFVLQTRRNLFLGYRNYLAGFSLDSAGKVVSISDEVLAAHD
jgi:hypothetical protein